MKYVVTGVNRLTGEREPISSPKEYMVAMGMLDRAKQKYAPSHRRPAYTALRLDAAAEEGSLF